MKILLIVSLFIIHSISFANEFSCEVAKKLTPGIKGESIEYESDFFIFDFPMRAEQIVFDSVVFRFSAGVEADENGENLRSSLSIQALDLEGNIIAVVEESEEFIREPGNFLSLEVDDTVATCAKLL